MMVEKYQMMREFCRGDMFKFDPLNRTIWEGNFPNIPKWLRGPNIRDIPRRTALCPKYSVGITLGRGWAKEIIEETTWIVEELTGRWYFNIYRTSIGFAFQHEQDAIHFKLRWR